MNLGLNGKTALVTASSKGIGKAVADELASEGCNVAICSRTKIDLENTADDLKRKYGVDISWSVCDLNKSTDIENTFNVVLRQFGKIDILVNNCGGPLSGFFRDFSDDQWVSAFEQVFLSAVRFSNLVVPGYTLTNRLYDLAVSRAKNSGLSHEEVLAEMARQVPMNRLARPEEIGALVAFLCSNQAGYITGNTIHIDGGWVKGLF